MVKAAKTRTLSRPRTKASKADAELLALGETLDRLLDEYERSYRIERRIDSRCARGRMSVEEAIQENDATLKKAGLRDRDGIVNELARPAARIRRLKAKTLAGLAVKARLARADCYRRDDAEQIRRGEVGVQSLHGLIDGVLELAAGVQRAPMDDRARAG
jgi:hypothetical protein